MRKIIYFIILLVFALSCMAQSQVGTGQRSAPDTGLVPLSAPYTISTAPHFAVLVEFPRADTIRRIALGDSNYFLAEADKDDPHYAIVKQIRVTTAKSAPPIETNMLVYMASGRVVNIMLKAGKLADTAYSVDYPVPNAQPATPANDPPPAPAESVKRESARAELADKMLADVKHEPKKDAGVAAGGIVLRFYRTERLGEIAIVSFDIENTTKNVIDLEDPRLNLVTVAEKSKDRKKGAASKIEPIELAQSEVSAKQLRPGERAVCVIAFKPPVHDSDQQILLSVANRAMADHAATYRVE
ncbi:MAG TPA: hypothetical protein VNX88_16670 [Terriglobales bacterium]|jgi:hypothetical protein|nr:hypothetical protein [Terriglobales bacterium]